MSNIKRIFIIGHSGAGKGVLAQAVAKSLGWKFIVENMAKSRGSTFIPVKFEITKDEHLIRLTKPERRTRWKSIDPQEAEDNGPLLSIHHANLLALEISDLSPDMVAEKIMEHINKQ